MWNYRDPAWNEKLTRFLRLLERAEIYKPS